MRQLSSSLIALLIATMAFGCAPEALFPDDPDADALTAVLSAAEGLSLIHI